MVLKLVLCDLKVSPGIRVFDFASKEDVGPGGGGLRRSVEMGWHEDHVRLSASVNQAISVLYPCAWSPPVGDSTYNLSTRY